MKLYCFGRKLNAYPLRLCLRWPLIGCSYVPACAVVCMCHSSAHSPKDWWATCRSRMRSGWAVEGGKRGKPVSNTHI